MIPAIVLDGSQRAALAAVRSLGMKGIPVTVGEQTPGSMAAASRFCGERFVYPDPYVDAEGFIESVLGQTDRYRDVLLLPITDVTLGEVLKNRIRFPRHVKIPFPEWSTYREVSDKAGLFRRAMDCEIPVPRTLFSTDFNSLGELIGESSALGFPLVVKPAFSRFNVDGRWIDSSVRYAADRVEMEEILKEEVFVRFPYLVQEKIEGYGIGIFLLMENGKVLSSFAHRRLREKPPSGGVSVLCESMEIPEAALKSAVGLLSAYNWSGVAMVEFKVDHRSGNPMLMEINARFWGSLQLAISSGVDFPYLLYLLAMGMELPTVTRYRTGVKSRWELGDLDHLIIRLLRSDVELKLPPGSPSKSALIMNFVADFFRPSVRHEVCRPNDPGPFFSELRRYVGELMY